MVDVGDARLGRRFESREFVLEPDQPGCLYHSESQQEAFLVPDPRQAYARFESPERRRPSYWDGLPWA